MVAVNLESTIPTVIDLRSRLPTLKLFVVNCEMPSLTVNSIGPGWTSISPPGALTARVEPST